MVQPGDTLWGIAERFLGDGSRWYDLYTYNELASTAIWPGEVIELPPADWSEEKPAAKPAEPESGGLPLLACGDEGQAVEALQLLLLHAGADLSRFGVDGEFGAETEAALRAFQSAEGLTVTGTTTPATWTKLVGG